MTNTLTINELPLRKSQSITLAFHHRTKMWWAVLWEGDRALTGSEEKTAHAALAELLVTMGARPDHLN